MHGAMIIAYGIGKNTFDSYEMRTIFRCFHISQENHIRKMKVEKSVCAMRSTEIPLYSTAANSKINQLKFSFSIHFSSVYSVGFHFHLVAINTIIVLFFWFFFFL